MPRRNPRSRLDLAHLVLLALFVFGPVVALAGEAPGPETLQLDVKINGQTWNYITPFTKLPDGRLATKRSELEELGIKPPNPGAPSDLIALDDVSGLSYAFDAAHQSIDIRVGDDLRVRKDYDARGEVKRVIASRADWGGVLNYNLYASSALGLRKGLNEFNPSFAGANTTLDGRLISPYGVLSQTGIVGTTTNTVTTTTTDNPSSVLRLETTFTYVDPDEATTYRAGDTISGSTLGWVRPIRLGGLQAQRNFAPRGDLVTGALPSLSGSAAVPSTVDIYVNNVKTYSQQVTPGPFQLSNLPIQSGSGDAQVVIRDAAGHETRTTMPFYAAPQLLKPGLTDFSAEVGAPRIAYALESDTYADGAVASGSLRHGVTDWLTVEAHGEGGLGVVNGGAGVLLRSADLGIAGLAISGSSYNSDAGLQLYGSFDTKIGKLSLHAQLQRGFGPYEDLASATARLRPSILSAATLLTATANGAFQIRPAREIDSLSVSMPLPFDTASLSASFIRSVPDQGSESDIGTLSLSRPLPYFKNASIFATAFHDFASGGNTGLYVGVNLPLGDDVSASLGGSRGSQGTTASASVSKNIGVDPGSWGWRVQDSEGQIVQRAASIGYRSGIARTEASVQQYGESTNAAVSVDGAVVTMGGGVYATNRIDDGFAVVNAGAPGVRVMRENRFVGETDADGKILIPGMQSYQRNKIEVDASNLPINAEIDASSQTVTPAFKSGAYVDFKVRTDVPSALVILKGADGKFLPVGTVGNLESGGAPFVIGYDGQAFIKDLKAHNTVTLNLKDSSCRVEFDFVSAKNTQTVIGPLVCQ